jgi:hypothetical protein
MRQLKTQPTSARHIVDALIPTPFPKPTRRVRENDYEYEYGETPRSEVIKKMRDAGVKGSIPGEYDYAETGGNEATERSMPDNPPRARDPQWPDYSDEYRGNEY